MRYSLGLVLFVLAATAQPCAGSPSCADFNRSGLGEALETVSTDLGEWNLRVPNVDLDGDGKSDQVLMFKGESPSRFPGDLAKVTISLSSSGKTYSAEFPHIALLRSESKYFVVGTTYSDGGFSKTLDIRQVDGRGITKLCALTVPSK